MNQEMIEIVGGSLKGLWVAFDQQNAYIISISEEDEDLLNARYELTLADREGSISFASGHPLPIVIGSKIGAMTRRWLLRRRLRKAESKAQSQSMVVNIYPLNTTVSSALTVELEYLRRSEAAAHALERSTDKKIAANPLALSSAAALTRILQDKVYDDLRESPHEKGICLFVDFVDGNSLAIADYDRDLRQRLIESSNGFDGDDGQLLRFCFDDPQTTLLALKEDLASIKSEATAHATAIERLKHDKLKSEKIRKLTALAALCGLQIDGTLSFKHSRLPEVSKLNALSRIIDSDHN